MSRSSRSLTLAAIVLVTSTLGACGDASNPTQPRRLNGASTTPQHVDEDDPSTCRAGWNSSTGRCE